MPRTMSAEEYQELGRRYYKLKQYEDAVEAFTKGLEIAPSPSLYDQRAASFDRLKNYTAAVKDGREMIKMDKKDIKGYLRTASVLEKMEKLDIALGIYKYGMKNVPVTDNNFKILQQMHDKINRKLSPARSVDPLTMLPVELAEMVLEYLTFRQVVNCMRVSRGWRDYLSKLPRLWLHLDMSGARKPIPRKFIDKAVRRAGNRVNRITVHRFEHMDILKNIAKTCKELTQLEFITLPHAMAASLIDIIGYAKNLKKLTVHPEITEDTASQLLNHRPSLEHAVFGAVKRSRTGGVNWTGQYTQLETLALPLINDIELDRHLFSGALFTHHAPKLRSLTLANVVITYDTLADLPLETLILRQVRVALGNLPRFPGSLHTLVCEGYNFKGEVTPRVLPQLTHLSLMKGEELSVRTMELFLDLEMDHDGNYMALKNGQPLRSLAVCGSLADRTAGLFRDSNSVFGRSSRILTPALKTLDIQTLPCDDSEIEHLLGYDVALTLINLSCTLISGASLKMLADRLPTLKSIIANNCPKINGRDAIEYVQRKGIAISCSMSEPKGSRRIRY